MSKTYHTLPRQPAALAAKSRKAGYHHDRRAPRGGARNYQREMLDEMDDFEVECDSCFE